MTFCLPPLRDRREDIEPNLDYELAQFARKAGRNVTFNKEAREKFLRFALSNEALWSANFRDLNAAVNRMATLVTSNRITVDDVDEEMERLRATWNPSTSIGWVDPGLDALLGKEVAAQLDRFDRVQLEDVLKVCAESSSIAEAGRTLFAQSRTQKKSANDSDRLRKYLQGWGINWEQIRKTQHS